MKKTRCHFALSICIVWFCIVVFCVGVILCDNYFLAFILYIVRFGIEGHCNLLPFIILFEKVLYRTFWVTKNLNFYVYFCIYLESFTYKFHSHQITCLFTWVIYYLINITRTAQLNIIILHHSCGIWVFTEEWHTGVMERIINHVTLNWKSWHWLFVVVGEIQEVGGAGEEKNSTVCCSHWIAWVVKGSMKVVNWYSYRCYGIKLLDVVV